MTTGVASRPKEFVTELHKRISMDDKEHHMYQIRTNRHPFNNVIWHQEKSGRLLRALARAIDILHRRCEPLIPKRDADSPVVEPQDDQETVRTKKSLEFELEEALHMAFTLYFFAIGRVKGVNDWESDKREIFEGGLEGLFKVMEQYDEHFQSPPSERYWPLQKEPVARKGSLLRRIERGKTD
jgi:hypothetical protein